MSRVYLLDAFGATVGSAILAQKNTEISAANVNAPRNLDICEASVVCDVQINDTHKSDPYLFSEWCRFSTSVASAVADEQSVENRCKTLENLENQFEGLWHAQHLKKKD